MRELRIRGGSGLGDSIYLRPVAEHFAKSDRVTVMSNYPDVFIGSGAIVEQLSHIRINLTAHYTQGKANPATNQWQDICLSAKADIPFRMTWQTRWTRLLNELLVDAAGRPIILVHGGRAPMGRHDGFGAELMPGAAGFEAALAALGSDYFTVRVGKGTSLYPLPVSVDLNDGTTPADIMDLGSICAGVIAQCSFAVPLAEGFDKPLLAVWASQGLLSKTPFIAQIKPEKVLSKPTSYAVMDTWEPESIGQHALAWRAMVAEREARCAAS